MERLDIARLADALELGLLRGQRLNPGLTSVRSLLQANLDGTTEYPSQRLKAHEGEAIAALLDKVENAIAPLVKVIEAPRICASDLTRALYQAFTNVADGAQIPGRQELDNWAAQLEARYGEGHQFAPRQLEGVLSALMVSFQVRTREERRSDIAIWGQLEARLQHPDLLILSALNEDKWPETADPGPWLSRGMRIAAGLEPPERRQGQAAHDFAQGLGNKQVIVSFSERVGSGPAIASRLVQRLEAFAGADVAKGWQSKGHHWIEQARRIDAVPETISAERPLPAPPPALRPRKLSITEIETLMRSPYDIYARHVLRLRPLDPLGEDPDARERGNITHDIFAHFVIDGHDFMAPDALDVLKAIAVRKFAGLEGIAERRDIWLRRFATTAEQFLAHERAREPRLKKRHAEIKGLWTLKLAEDFVLTGRADRVDEMEDGTLEIIDFKTGAVPTPAAMKAFEVPQLLLEAQMARIGALEGVGAAQTSRLTYIKIGLGPEAFAAKDFVPADGFGLMDAADELSRRMQRHVVHFLFGDVCNAGAAAASARAALCWSLRPSGAGGRMDGGRWRGGRGMSGERGQLQVPFDTARNQTQAAHPGWSIWVSANAGSGKTYVLTRRVLRMLLAGVKPESILCLTYTKAAAAEMRRRVANALGAWAVMDQRLLDKELVEIEGDRLTNEMRERARTLFARALETPGGLKIVTIHAFCESVLHRFPLEARVPFDFSVIEDEEREGMLLQARERVLAEGLHVEGAVETLFQTLSDSQIVSAIDAALADGRKLKAVLRNVAASKLNLRKLLGDFPSVRELTQSIVADRLIGKAQLDRLYSICPPEGGSRLEDKLAALHQDDPEPEGWLRAFLTKDDTVPVRFPVKAISTADPALADQLLAEAERLASIAETRRTAGLIDRSDAMLDIVAAIAEHYEARKRARSLLDFDDLVSKLASLFETQSADWVRYKLDAGIDHILVDESQDTNGEQWRVVKAITAEFFSGAGAVDRPRSLFAVGDQKQSIYSFQGAEPKLFGETGREYQRLAENVQAPFRPLPLHTSFRTLPEILQAVDLVSDAPHIQAALLETDKVHHNTARLMRGGSVTLWPPVQQADDARAGGEWPINSVEAEQTAPRQVAMRIAREIDGWIKARRPLTGRGRAVTADDVMILVQARGPLFAEVIRGLRKLKIPTPGADRLNVTGHIAVMDLLALCDVLLNPADNLQLAALLSSPLFDVSEDDLFDLCQREDGETLWQALERCTAPLCREAADRLHRWRGALDFERPFEFLAQVLYAEGGLKRFHKRMGQEVDDVFAELLALAIEHEQTSQPSLQGFVSNLRTRSVSVKRELAETGGGVRVMTVHGAKGLEAPIVILADGCKKPLASQISKPVYLLAEAPGPLLIHAAGAKGHVAGTLGHKQDVDGNIQAEYWRRLYVGMTRAEDELYVTGALTPGNDRGKQLAGSWYEAIETALRPLGESQVDENGREVALVYPRERVPPVPPQVMDVRPSGAADGLEFSDVAEPVMPLIVSPSTARGHLSQIEALDSLLEQTRSPDEARREGVVLHALLQHLVPIERALWPVIVPKALLALLPEAPERHEALGAKAMSILSRTELQHLFGRNSRAEVPFLVDALRDGKPIRLAGRIDRVVVDDQGVTVIDYKSDASVPMQAADVPGNYRTQLGLYALVAGQLFPGHPVRAAILWTQLESLMNLPPDMLAAGSKGFTMR